jgi:hypothetical protein
VQLEIESQKWSTESSSRVFLTLDGFGGAIGSLRSETERVRAQERRGFPERSFRTLDGAAARLGRRETRQEGRKEER